MGQQLTRNFAPRDLRIPNCLVVERVAWMAETEAKDGDHDESAIVNQQAIQAPGRRTCEKLTLPPDR